MTDYCFVLTVESTKHIPTECIGCLLLIHNF